MRAISDALRAAAAAGEAVLMATVVRTEGSTYRRAGARMLVRSDGSTMGTVSAGCLEADVVSRYAYLMESGVPELVSYDSRGPDDFVWGLGLGCDGVVDVLLEPLFDTSLMRARALCALLCTAETPMAVATVVRSDQPGVHVGERLVLSEFGLEFAQFEPDGPLRDVTRHAAAALADARSRAIECGPDGGIMVCVDVVAPPVELVVCGAGPDALPVVDLAMGLGWRVTVVDDRPAYARTDRFRGAVVRCLRPGEPLGAAAALGPRTAAVVMSHHYERDLAYVEALVGAGAAYVGLLGPRRRADRLLADLEARGHLPDAMRARLYGPAGLDIGGEGPEAIALSIVSEVAAVMAARSGESLRDRRWSIHTTADGDVHPARHRAPLHSLAQVGG